MEDKHAIQSVAGDLVGRCRVWCLKHIKRAPRSYVSCYELLEAAGHAFAEQTVSASISNLYGVKGKKINGVMIYQGLEYIDPEFSSSTDLDSAASFLNDMPLHVCSKGKDFVSLASEAFGNKQIYIIDNEILIKTEEIVLITLTYQTNVEFFDHLLTIVNSYVCRSRQSPTCARVILAGTRKPPLSCEKCNGIARKMKSRKRSQAARNDIGTTKPLPVSENFQQYVNDQVRCQEQKSYPKEVIDDSLAIYCKSPATYRLIRDRGRFGKLPSESTLRRHKSLMRPFVGCDEKYLDWMSSEVHRLNTPVNGFSGALCVDEMSIKVSRSRRSKCSRTEIDDVFLPPMSSRETTILMDPNLEQDPLTMSNSHLIPHGILHRSTDGKMVKKKRKTHSAPTLQHAENVETISDLSQSTFSIRPQPKRNMVSRGVSRCSFESRQTSKRTIRVFEQETQTEEIKEQGVLDCDDMDNGGFQRHLQEQIIFTPTAETSIISHICLQVSDSWDIILDKLLRDSKMDSKSIDAVRDLISKLPDNRKMNAVFERWMQVHGRFDTLMLCDVLRDMYRNDLVIYIQRIVDKSHLHNQILNHTRPH